jgi:hypothetical protein
MNVRLDVVQEVREALDSEWGYQISNNQITSKFCPVCQAMVPWSSNNESVAVDAAIQVHKQYHLDMARILSGLNAWHTPIG